jgi:hypothetical protein
MKTQTLLALSFFTILALYFPFSTREIRSDPPPRPNRWEYKVITIVGDTGGDLEQKLNKLGDAGWEYAGPLTITAGTGRVALKRPKG